MATVRRSPLVMAVVAFVVLDLGVLVLNYTISWHIARDAVAINLAGRQRMLSQRTTKAALLAIDPSRAARLRETSAAEAAQAWGIFHVTLDAFARGGWVPGGDGQRAHLDGVQGQAEILVGEVMGQTTLWPEAPTSGPALQQFAQFMVENNGQVLESMNSLTSELEHQSVALTQRLRFLQTIAFSLSLVNFAAILHFMHQARRKAERDSRTDRLTGIANRSGLFTALEEALEAGRGRRGVGVLLFDLDGFKAVNDTYGHASGDDTLREVARRVDTWRKPGWTCGRIGGDEFVVVCPGVDAGELEQAATDLGQLLSGLPGGELMVSASVGWAASDGASTADSLLMAADTRMYGHKHRRRAGEFPAQLRRPWCANPHVA